MRPLHRLAAPVMLGAVLLAPCVQAASVTTWVPAAAHAPFQADDLPAPTHRNGQEILQRFRVGLADPSCNAEMNSERWQRQFRQPIARLADPDDPLLPLFGYVVDELHREGLPSEFALIPFVESGYRPGATSRSGPAGLWQFIAATARNHKVPMESGMDGRLSAAESTQAAIRYLKSLYGIFGGRWELAVMGYNAGEYRILQALRRQGLNAGSISTDKLASLSPSTYSYVEKIHALSCLLDNAVRQGTLQAGLDREVPILTSTRLPAGTAPPQWAAGRSESMDELVALNPLMARKQLSRPLSVLVPASPGLDHVAPPAVPAPQVADTAVASLADNQAAEADRSLAATSLAGSPGNGASARFHTVQQGDSLWAIARRHGLAVQALLSLNGLDAASVLRPGTVLRIEP